jgi:hypothetical protein
LLSILPEFGSLVSHGLFKEAFDPPDFILIKDIQPTDKGIGEYNIGKGDPTVEGVHPD